MVSKPTPCCSPLGPQDTRFSGPVFPPSRLEALPKPQHPPSACRYPNQTPSRASAAQPREEDESSCVLCVPQSSGFIVGFWGVSAFPVFSIAPLPFFSIASTSFTRSGGAISGGLNCSCKSGRGDPGGEGGREGLSTSSALSSRAGSGHNPGNSQQEQGKPCPPCEAVAQANTACSLQATCPGASPALVELHTGRYLLL